MSRFVSAYSDKVKADLYITEPSMTKQSFKVECDINNILRKYKKNMGMDFLNQYQGYLSGKFGDVSAGVDYHTARNQMIEAEAVFMQMPASLRTRFDNDPGKMLSFLGDVNNRDEAVQLGLLKKPEKVSVDDKSPVPPAG